MVAYSFKQRFVEPILSGAKRQTIRAHRKRHARPGELIQLYTAMRTKQCRLLAERECTMVEGIRIDVSQGIIAFEHARSLMTRGELDAFAKLNGFADWPDMRAFWKSEHPDAPTFDGVLIRWSPQ